MRIIIPLFLIIVAGALFFGITSNVFVDIDALRLKQITLDQDLAKAQEVQKKFETLRAESEAITPTQLLKLKLLLPTSVDTVDLLVKINGLAKSSAMTLADVKIKTEIAKDNNKKSGSQIAGLGTATFNFTVIGSYGSLRQFLNNVERNFRLADISTISFSAVEKEPYQYNIELKTYWLK